MSKSDKRFIIISFFIALIMAFVLIRFYQNTKNESDYTVVGDLQQQIVSSIYDEHEDVLGLKHKNNIALDTVMDKTFKDVTPEVAIVLDEIKQYYDNVDFKSLYKLINQEYLEKLNVSLSYNMFKEEQEKLLGKGYKANKLRYDGVIRISTYYYCDITFTGDNNSDQENGSSNVNATFTIFFHEDGTYSYLPFNIDDLFIRSDYGVTRVGDIDTSLQK